MPVILGASLASELLMAYSVCERYMKNFHLPLAEQTHEQLRPEARHNMIARYAKKLAGTDLDLDLTLESAAIEHLIKRSKTQMKLAPRAE